MKIVRYLNASGHTKHGALQPDGTFKIKTSTGTGVPNGKYKVSFTHYGAPGAKAGGSPATRSIPEVWDVTPTTKSFTLDIATVTGKNGGRAKPEEEAGFFDNFDASK